MSFSGSWLTEGSFPCGISSNIYHLRFMSLHLLLGKSGHLPIFRIPTFYFWSQVELTVVQNDLIDIELNSRNQMKHGSPTLAPSSLFPLILYTSVKYKIFSNFSYVLYLELSITLYFFLNIRVIWD